MIVLTGHTKGIGAAISDKLIAQGSFFVGIARTKAADNANLIQLSYDLGDQKQIAGCCNNLKKYNKPFNTKCWLQQYKTCRNSRYSFTIY